jgi:hypothetical protein
MKEKKVNLKLKDVVNVILPGTEIIVREYGSGKELYRGQGFYLTGAESLCKGTVKEISNKNNIMIIKVK